MKKSFILTTLIFTVVLVLGILGFIAYKSKVKAINVSEPKEFKMQGLMFSTVAYYYTPATYFEVYNPVNSLKTIKSAKASGSNYLLLKAFYSGTKDGKLRGNDPQQEFFLRNTINLAHENGMKVFLVPFVDSHDYWVLKDWTLDMDLWTKTVVKWAEFAEENNVEMYAPGVEMNLIFPKEEIGRWYKNILPKIREVYFGNVATAEHPYLGKWEAIDEADGFSGYDCIGAAIYPWSLYQGKNDIRSIDEYKSQIEEKSKLVLNTAEKNNINCKIASILGMDFWMGGFPDANARANGYSAGLDVLKEQGFDGVFLHMWMDERGQPNLTKEVGGMLKNRWYLGKNNQDNKDKP